MTLSPSLRRKTDELPRYGKNLPPGFQEHAMAQMSLLDGWVGGGGERERGKQRPLSPTSLLPWPHAQVAVKRAALSGRLAGPPQTKEPCVLCSGGGSRLLPLPGCTRLLNCPPPPPPFLLSSPVASHNAAQSGRPSSRDHRAPR